MSSRSGACDRPKTAGGVSAIADATEDSARRDATVASLLYDVVEGDRRAFAMLYEAAAPKLYGVCLRICRSKELAEDALQDAFVHIWRQAERYDEERGTAMAWMSAIARNRAIDVLRRRGRDGRGSDAGVQALDTMADPRAVADGGVDVIALARCMDRLDARGQELVLLAYFEGWTREELAERMGSPVGSVKTWLRRGLATLKSCLEEG